MAATRRAPVRKVKAASAGGGALVVLVGLVDLITGLRLDTEVLAVLVGALASTGCAYAAAPAPGEQPPPPSPHVPAGPANPA